MERSHRHRWEGKEPNEREKWPPTIVAQVHNVSKGIPYAILIHQCETRNLQRLETITAYAAAV